jgi:hypothetical protein
MSGESHSFHIYFDIIVSTAPCCTISSECCGFANPWRVWLKGLKGMGQGTRVATHSIPLPL